MGRGGSHVRGLSQGAGGVLDEGDTSQGGGEGSLGQVKGRGGGARMSSSQYYQYK